MPKFQKKISKPEIFEVLKKIVEKNESEKNKVLVTLSSLESHIYIEKKIDVTQNTLRTRGINPQGIFIVAFPEVFSYHSSGRSNRGLVINKEKFKEKKTEMEKFFDDRE